MDKKITQVSRDIRNGKVLEENISLLLNYLADQYHAYAGVKLVMHYFSFYEAYLDDGEIWSAEAKDILSQLKHVIKNDILSKQKGYEFEKSIRFVDDLRNSIIKRMKLLTAYTDIFQVYEYILNRVEYRFKEVTPTIKDEEFEGEILSFIFDTQDNMIINEKIKEIIGQLPIRMTKQKYFDLLKDSIRLYLGADQASLDSYLYMLKTSAMLYLEEGMDTYYPKLWEQKTFLAHLKYKEITTLEFEEAENVLKQATIFLERETDIYVSLQEIVNEVYAILLCEPYVGMAKSGQVKNKESIFSLLLDINKAIMNPSQEELLIDLMDKFSEIEGVQEELSEDLTLLEDTLYEIDKNHRALAESMMTEKLLNAMLRTKDLLSNSLFIEWNEIKEDKSVDKKVVEEVANHLEEELSTLFEEQDRLVSRAVMANTLNKIPVFFKDHNEVIEYIHYCLERCNDSYEKAACVEIISDIMSE